MADAFFKKWHGALDVRPAVKFLELLCSIFKTVADHRHETGHHCNAVWVTTGLDHTILQACIEGLCFGKALLSGKNNICNTRCEILTRPGRACLNENGMALRRTRNVERTLNRIIFAGMIEHMHLAGIGVDAVFLVFRKGIVVPAIPKTAHDIDEFLGNGITLVMFRVALREIVGRAGVRGGDNVPGGATMTQMVDRSECACGMIGLAVSGGSGGSQPDLVRDHGQCG